MGYRGTAPGAVALVMAVLFLLLIWTGSAFASDAPHVTNDDAPDTCAMCHRSKTAAGSAVWRRYDGSTVTTRSALTVGVPLETAPGTFEIASDGDVSLCYVCHGIEAAGSTSDVQSAFMLTSAHRLASEESSYGPSPKQCSDCHDSHGPRRDDDSFFSVLLRAYAGDGTWVNEGPEYCAACHVAREESRFDGLEIFLGTGHASLEGPASGTGVTCSACHEAHGSAVAPLIVSELLEATEDDPAYTVEANDRTLCYGCHTEADEDATWDGEAVHDAASHGSSEATVAVSAEWASEEESRLVGECQACHAPMGRDDGDGGVIPKLAEAEGNDMCYQCHDGSLDEAFDMTYILDEEGWEDNAEIVVAFDPIAVPGAFSLLGVYSPVAYGSSQGTLEGPRVFSADDASTARYSDLAQGDVLGSPAGTPKIVAVDGSAAELHVFAADSLRGLAGESYAIQKPGLFVEVGDFVSDSTGYPEIAVAEFSMETSSTVRLYRWAGTQFGQVDVAPLEAGHTVTGMTSGNLAPGGDAIVVTAVDDDGDGFFYVLSRDDAPNDDKLDVAGPFAAGQGARGPSIGDVVSAAGNEIVIANSGAGTIQVFNGDGDAVATASTSAAMPWDAVVGELLPGGERQIAVALRNETAQSAVDIFKWEASGLELDHSVETGNRQATSTLATGRLPGDARDRLFALGAGYRQSDPAPVAVAPLLQTFVVNGGSLTIEASRVAGGTELVGGTPALLVADLGGVGPSRHPSGAVERSHVSTETADTFVRHVDCVDCHNVHALDDTPKAAPAPSPRPAFGSILGTWGAAYNLSTSEYSLAKGIEYEYELCFKCHSGWPDDDAEKPARDIAAELTAGISFHPVLEKATNPFAASTFTATSGLDAEDILYCTDCHGNAAASDPLQPAGSHRSTVAPLLQGAYRAPASGDDLCAKCHRADVYVTGTHTADGGFFDATSGEALHPLHVDVYKMSCAACHVSHGGSNEHLIRMDVDWVHADNGGACFTECHGPSTANAYSRVSDEVGPTGITPLVYQSYSGNLDSVLVQGDSDVFQIQERQLAQDGSVLRVEVEFTGVTATPTSFELFGRYQGNPGHTVRVQAWNYMTSGWVTLGELPHTAGPGYLQFTYPVANPVYVSGGILRIRIDHAPGGIDTHWVYLDRVWLRY